MKSLAGVAAKTNPFVVTRSPWLATAARADVPALAMEPSAFSTTLARPPRLLPGVGLAVRSVSARARYSSYQRISRIKSSATCLLAARGVSRCTASRTSVTSENITVAPARTSRSAANPTAGLQVTPENASLPPHCSPTTSSDAGTVSRRRRFSCSKRFSAARRIAATTSANPRSSCMRTTRGSLSNTGKRARL